ncbi:ATP-binding cassette domain-containing protein [Streptomyces sp. NBC_00005]|uniref:ATP-binding cassette domain-containing protein n=1 Tax=Streptomyces sp. NBC_00005 TaxID=2903609 RepID=UPI0032531F64
MPAVPAVISAARLARTFQTKRGPVEAVRGIDLTVREGEILGFLGPNGAGKTTTLRMLTTLLTPTGGAATVAGHDLAADPAGVRRACGYVAQSGGVDGQISVREELVTQGRLYRLTRTQAIERARELAHDLDLTDLLDRRTSALSGGQRRRLDIAMALTHRPKVLFLDEPTTGLDPGSRADLWDLIRLLRDAHGTTVFLTTHYLDEADALSDRLVIVDKGVVVAEGTPSALKLEHGSSIDASLQDTFLAITGRGPAAPADAAPVAV